MFNFIKRYFWVIVWSIVVCSFVYLWEGMHFSFLKAFGYTLACYLIYVIFVFSMALLIHFFALRYSWVPRWLQKPFYEKYKSNLEKIEMFPLLQFPFSIWLKTTIDDEFEKGGLKGASAACER